MLTENYNTIGTVLAHYRVFRKCILLSDEVKTVLPSLDKKVMEMLQKDKKPRNLFVEQDGMAIQAKVTYFGQNEKPQYIAEIKYMGVK